MTKRVQTLISIMCLSIMLSGLTVSAEGIQDPVQPVEQFEQIKKSEQTQTEQLVDNSLSLDEVIANNQQEQSEQQNETTSTEETVQANEEDNQQDYVSADDFINGLGESGKIGLQQNETTEKIAKALKAIVTPIVQLLSHLIVIGLVVRVILDLIYIVIPFSRKLLLYGQNVETSGNMGVGNMGNGGYPTASQMMTMSNGQNALGGQGEASRSNKVQIISNAAIRAVQGEQSGQSVFRYYFKDMLVVMVVTPILLVLTLTGVLMDLGFILGDAICGLIVSLGAMV